MVATVEKTTKCIVLICCCTHRRPQSYLRIYEIDAQIPAYFQIVLQNIAPPIPHPVHKNQIKIK